MGDNKTDTFISRIFDAFSLSGAIILMLFALTLIGIITQQIEVWRVFGSALTSFVTAKKVSQNEEYNAAAKRKKVEPNKEN